MKTAILAAFAILLLTSTQVRTEEIQLSGERKLCVITLKSGTKLRGWAWIDGAQVHTDDGSGDLPFDGASLIKAETLSAEGEEALLQQIAKRKEYAEGKRQKRRAESPPKDIEKTISREKALPVNLRIGNGTLTIDCFLNVFYLDKNGFGVSETRIHHTYNKGYDTEGYYTVSGNLEKIQFASQDESLLRVDANTGRCFCGGKTESGSVNITVTLAGKTAVIPVKIARLPIIIGDSTDTVIKTMGLPDFKQSVFVSWPDCKGFHNVTYCPDAAEGIRTGDHWGYKKYPGAVVVIQGGKVKTISSTTLDDEWGKSRY